MDGQQNEPIICSSPKPAVPGPSNFSKSNSTSTIDNKMTNVAKLRQQFIEEVKDIELSLKETIKNYKSKIAKVEKKSIFITEKLRETNKLLCNQSETIFNKARENKILREKVLELYDYQKTVFENVEDISNTLEAQKNTADDLYRIYNNVHAVQQMNNEKLEKKLFEITPDQKYLNELAEINKKINETNEVISKKKNVYQQLDVKLKQAKINKEEYRKQITESTKIKNDLMRRNDLAKQKGEELKKNLHQEITNLKQEGQQKIAEIAKFDSTISKLKQDLLTKKTKYNERELELTKINKEIELLTKEKEELQMKNDKEENKQTIALKKLEEQLKMSQSLLASVKEKEINVINVLKNKNDEVSTKIKGYNGIEIKLDKVESAVKKEQETIHLIDKEYEKNLNAFNDKIKSMETKCNELKSEINEKEGKIQKSVEEIASLEDSISKLDDKLKDKLLRIKEMEKHLQVVCPTDLAELFAADQKNRRKLYTPTLADDDLEIDSLSIEDQLTHLTQSKLSDSQSSEKGKRFFKSSNLSQVKNKKELTPRGRGRGKKA